MTRAVRIRQHLYDEIERLAKSERRSLISQLEVLLEQALILQERSEESAPHRDGGAGQTRRKAGEPTRSESGQNRARPAVTDSHFKPDPKR
jgi:hypothetical protein